VTITKPDGTLVVTLKPFGPSFTGDAHVAYGDLNGDGTDDIIVAAGAGGGPQVTVYDGGTFAVIASFFALPPTFGGGVFVASADLNGDGTDDIIVGAGTGGGPQVTVYDGKTFAVIASFYAFDPSFRSGVRVAVADVNGDGVPDVVCSAGRGGGPEILIVDGTKLNQSQSNGQIANSAVLAAFYALTPSFTGGVYVAAGDLNHDGLADIVVGADAGGGPQVTIFDGKRFQMMSSFYAFAPNFTGGVRVGIGDFTGNGHLSLLVARGSGSDPIVNIYDGDTLNLANSYLAFDRSVQGGVFVSATR
jgi:hypothetical protein